MADGVARIFEQLNTRHRDDIDGLRAIAVIPVLLFHAGLPGFSGGFLGVDIFFVISGFLITSILVREAEEGRFSILAFYNRRVRRIFPALFAMLLVVTIAASFILAPMALVAYGRSLVATTLFSSNILFWRQTGYFAASALEKPLLHTWSLAVEEQFYLVWPLLIGLIYRLNGRRLLLPLLCVGVALSFALAAVWPNREAVFYLPVTRAWELGLGAMLAVRPLKLPAWFSFVGAAAIVFGIVGLGEQTPLVVASGAACLGTAILISTEGPVNRLLSYGPCVGIGLISYSLYLWHWPLLAFAHYMGNPSVPLRLALLLLSGVLAYLSYRFVETPLRRKAPPRKAFAVALPVMAAFVAGGLAIVIGSGFPLRYGPAVASAETHFSHERFCAGCAIGHGPPSVVLWGDSHAMAAQPAVMDFLDRKGLGAVAFTRPGCPPLIGAARDAGCAAFHKRAEAAIAKLDPKLIILAARWSISSETTRFGSETGGRYFLVDAKTHAKSIAESRRALSEGLFRTVAELTKAHPHATILLIGQAPDLGVDAEQCMIAALTKGGCETVRADALPRLDFSERLLGSVAATFPNVRVIDLRLVLCRNRQCPTHSGGAFFYRDPTHLSDSGERLLLEPQLMRLD